MLQVFRMKTGIFTVLVNHGTLIASDGGSSVNDPFSNKIWIMADFQKFEAVTAVKDPLPDTFHTGWNHDRYERIAFKKCAFLKYFQRIWKYQFLNSTKIKGLYSNTVNFIGKVNSFEIFASVKSSVTNICNSVRKIDSIKRSTSGKGI